MTISTTAKATMKNMMTKRKPEKGYRLAKIKNIYSLTITVIIAYILYSLEGYGYQLIRFLNLGTLPSQK